MASVSLPSAEDSDDAVPPGDRVVPAIFDGEVIRPAQPLHLPPGTPIRLVLPATVTIVAERADATQPQAIPVARPAAPPPTRPAALPLFRALAFSPATALLGAGLIFYALTRLVGLSVFPIFFFCDEAIQVTLARALLANGLRDADGTLLPPFFLNAEKWNLSLSVYLHALSVALVGHSIELTRATSALVSVLGVAAVALTLRLVFNSPGWWLAPLAMAAMPAWFLHSRTAFETVMMVAFYACFLCCYLLYRTRGPRWLVPALLCGGATFYSYANGQGVMLVTGLLLLLLDLPYHLRQGRRVWLAAAGVMLLLLAPLLRFRLLQPDAYADQLRHLDSYWLRPFPLSEKLARFAENYLLGLSPGYWFLPNTVDLERHRMLGMGHLGLWLAPLILVGLFVCLRSWRSPVHRAVLVAALAAPFSAALVGIGITRVLAMVVPGALLAVLGLDQIAAWLAPYLRRRTVNIAGALALALSALVMMRAALVEGPTWFTNYGLAGMQFGARQLFAEAIPATLAADPDTMLLVSPTWANNPNTFVDFFLVPAQRDRVQLVNVDAFTMSRRDLDPARHLFVMPEYEYERARASGKFVMAEPERVILYPDGRPGFYFVRMGYVPNVDAIFEADRMARAQLVEAEAIVGGERVPAAHSALDMGSLAQLFDGDPNTLMRGLEANPLVVELRFPEPRTLTGIALTTGSMNMELTLRTTPAGDEAPLVAVQSFVDLPPDPTVTLDLPGGPQVVQALRLEIRQLNAPEIANIHLRELVLR